MFVEYDLMFVEYDLVFPDDAFLFSDSLQMIEMTEIEGALLYCSLVYEDMICLVVYYYSICHL